MRKIKYIINPAAGDGSSKNAIEIIHKKMAATNIEYTISLSGYKGHVEKLATEAVEEGYTDIVAVGGDGTVLEVYNGLCGSEVTLGIIPAGTGNDFGKMLKLDKDIEKNVDKVIVGHTILMDVGLVNNTHFLNVVGFGIDGEIVEKTETVKKKIKGPAAYIYSTFSVLLTYKCQVMHIKIDDMLIKRKCYLVAVGNGKYYGGGMMITPGAEIDNNKFEIVIINEISKLKFAVLFRKVFSGKHVYESPVEVFYGNKIEITSDVAHKINADGNIIGSGKCEVEIMPKAQKVIL